MGFEIGNSGKPKGAVSQTTKESRELFVKTLDGQLEHIESAFAELRNESAEKYLNTFSRYCKFFIPIMKEQTATTDTYLNMVNLGEGQKAFSIKDIFKVESADGD